jgi:hypothetical protein
MAWSKGGLARILILVAVIGAYIFGLLRNVREANLRSLELKGEAPEADRVLILISITNVNPATRLLSAQLAFGLSATLHWTT